MTKFIVDSFAWIEDLLGTERGNYVKKIIEDKNNEIFTHILSISELVSRFSRLDIRYSETINNILSNSTIINININLCIKAGEVHAQIRKKLRDFGLVDAFILTVAKDMKLKILTGDQHFKNFKEAIII